MSEGEEAQGGSEGGELPLEARLSRLEEIVRTLEDEEPELERALALFEEGVGHVRNAEELLARAELRVEELLGGGDVRPFQEEDE